MSLARDLSNNRLLTLGTSQNSTSGTNIDFTGIPVWAKRVTVIFNGVSTTGANDILLQLGVGSTPTTSGYAGGQSIFSWGSGVLSTTSTAGIPIYNNSGTYIFYGSIQFVNISGNTWVAIGSVVNSQVSNSVVACGGAITLSGTLGMIRITTSTGTPTFDAGSINIMYE